MKRQDRLNNIYKFVFEHRKRHTALSSTKFSHLYKKFIAVYYKDK